LTCVLSYFDSEHPDAAELLDGLPVFEGRSKYREWPMLHFYRDDNWYTQDELEAELEKLDLWSGKLGIKPQKSPWDRILADETVKAIGSAGTLPEGAKKSLAVYK
jgi:hypothetical protein